MKEIQRLCLKVEATIATLLAENPSAIYIEEERDLLRALNHAKSIRGRSS